MASPQRKNSHVTNRKVASDACLPVILLNLFKTHTCHIYFSLAFKLVETEGRWSLEIFITKAPKTCCDSLSTLNPSFWAKCGHNTTGYLGVCYEKKLLQLSFWSTFFHFECHKLSLRKQWSGTIFAIDHNKTELRLAFNIVYSQWFLSWSFEHCNIAFSS